MKSIDETEELLNALLLAGKRGTMAFAIAQDECLVARGEPPECVALLDLVFAVKRLRGIDSEILELEQSPDENATDLVELRASRAQVLDQICACERVLEVADARRVEQASRSHGLTSKTEK